MTPARVRLSDLALPARTRPHAVVTLAAGRAALDLRAASHKSAAAYADRLGAQAVALTGPETRYGMGFKFALAAVAARWDRFVYFDVDVFVAADCPDLLALVPPDRMGMYDEWPRLPKTDWLTDEYSDLADRQGWTALPAPRHCYNTGVIVASSAHAGAFDRPTKPFAGTRTAEQSLINLNVARHRLPVYNLPETLNWQWWFPDSKNAPPGTAVWHYSSAPVHVKLRLLRERAGAAGGRTGTELKNLLSELGADPTAGCGSCAALARSMDEWGPDGCRANEGVILAKLRTAASRLGWAGWLRAGMKAFAAGLAVKINPLDPAPALLREALRRSEAPGG